MRRFLIFASLTAVLVVGLCTPAFADLIVPVNSVQAAVYVPDTPQIEVAACVTKAQIADIESYPSGQALRTAQVVQSGVPATLTESGALAYNACTEPVGWRSNT